MMFVFFRFRIIPWELGNSVEGSRVWKPSYSIASISFFSETSLRTLLFIVINCFFYCRVDDASSYSIFTGVFLSIKVLPFFLLYLVFLLAPALGKVQTGNTGTTTSSISVSEVTWEEVECCTLSELLPLPDDIFEYSLSVT